MKSAKKPTRKNKPTENVEVFCRIRPIEPPTCVSKISNTILSLNNIDLKTGAVTRETRYSFQKVFDETCKQEEVFDRIAFPLVDNLVHGKNGLLFAYGVTSSGKTHTMQGVSGDRGILHRCLDTLFNSIRLLQSKKYIFKPDKMNSFDVQTEADSFLERQARDITPRMLGHKNSRLSASTPSINTETISPKINDIDSDSYYSVFVKYVEVYNNYVYDLLEDAPLDFIAGNKSPTSKNIREDGEHRMYVSGVVEEEVSTAEEAVELFKKGQIRRKVASTSLNTESSRSHSVFTLRLVRGALDARGESVIMDKRKLVVSELSLVDLAGSERSNRTGSNGDRLKEAGNINQSLMVLRTCIEVLRENQKNFSRPTRQLVPYRDSKITLLFRSYFEGEGKVSMVVCVNPMVAEYDETMYVMKFAELAQEVQIAKALAPKLDLGLVPGRRQANLQNRDINRASLDDLSNKVYPPFPNHLLKDSTDERSIDDLLGHLRDRQVINASLQNNYQHKQSLFRDRLVEMENEVNEGREITHKTKQQLKESLHQLEEIRKREQEKDHKIDSLVMKLKMFEVERHEFEKEMGEKNWAILQEKLKNNRLRLDYNAKLDLNAKQYNQNIEQAKRKIKDETVLKLRGKQQKLDLVKSIINCSNPPTPVPDTPRRGYTRTNDYLNNNPIFKMPLNPTSTTKKRTRSPPPVKPKPHIGSRRRSKSTENLWLEHRPQPIDHPSSILHPKLKSLRSVAKINEKDLKATEANKYLLSHQGYDSQGELVTKFHKGDIMTSATGGTSVVFNDVEVVKNTTPGHNKRRSATPPPSDGQWTDVETRCQVGLDGHAINKKFKCSEL